MRIAEGDFAPSAFVTRQHGKPADIVIFTRRSHVIEVRSAVQRIDPALIALFSNQAFKRFPAIERIEFQPMMVGTARAGFDLSGRPFQAVVTSEDFVKRLPPDAETYRKDLAKSTRRGLTRSLNRLAKQYPDFSFEVHGPEVGAQVLEEIFRIHYKRMQARGIRSAIDAKYKRRIVALVRHFGLVGVLRIDGRVAAGSINYVVGDRLYSETVAHDPAYNFLKLGVLCTYLMILEVIARNVREWHFLWGASEFKQRLGGIKHDLVAIIVYRSRAAALRNTGSYLSRSISSRIRALRITAAKVRIARAAVARFRMIARSIRP
ncbi:MAG: GNAT family N-acetyltransferase [Sphingomonadales bacterium]|nr:GNAT family N-acetyltransferase [Sphingomonadales bacterium]